MEKPQPGTRIIQKANQFHEYIVIPDENVDQDVGKDRFAVKSVKQASGGELGTFPVCVLHQDNFYISPA